MTIKKLPDVHVTMHSGEAFTAWPKYLGAPFLDIFYYEEVGPKYLVDLIYISNHEGLLGTVNAWNDIFELYNVYEAPGTPTDLQETLKVVIGTESGHSYKLNVELDIIGTSNLIQTYEGWGGVDTMFGAPSVRDETFNCRGGADVVLAGAGNDIVNGGSGNDRVLGESDNDVLNGDGGNDELEGDDGDDYLSGGDGNDVIGGGYGNDQLSGGNGRDELWGDEGNDQLTGGMHADQFVFWRYFGLDTIADFDATGKDHDVLDLSGLKSIVSFKDLKKNHLDQDGRHVVIDSYEGEIVLTNVKNENLDAADFVF